MEISNFGEILELQRGYDLPASEMKEGKVPVAGSNGIIGYHDIAKVKAPCITIGRSGSVGKVHFYNEDIWAHNTSLFVSNFKGNNEKYIYYLLKSKDFAKLCDSSVVPSLNRNFVYPMKTLFESNIKTQQKIAAVLSSLDDKIALNRRINAKLEAMAKRLYDYWFVQFDFPTEDGKPYKSSGGKMVYNATLKRDIPAGWEVGNLYNIAEYVNGLACQNYRPQDDEKYLPVIKIKEMHDGITTETGRVSENIPNKYKIYDGDILFSWSATLEVMLWCNGNGGLNQHIFKVNPKDYFSKEYVLQQLDSYIVNFQKQAESRKTTMGHITSEHINQSRITIPPKEVIEHYTKVVAPIYEKIIATSKQIQKLTAIRDRLLPLLMNGQVEVK